MATDIALKQRGKNILDDLGTGSDLRWRFGSPLDGTPSRAGILPWPLVVRNILSYGSITSRSNFKKLGQGLWIWGASVFFPPMGRGFRGPFSSGFLGDFFPPQLETGSRVFHWGTEILWNSGSWFFSRDSGEDSIKATGLLDLTSQFGFFQAGFWPSYGGRDRDYGAKTRFNRRIILTLALDFLGWNTQ